MRKVGSETPTSDTASISCESQESRRRAVYTPMETPPTSASRAATADSSSVAGRRSAISFDTGCAWRRLSPKSPCSALSTNRAYWT